MKETSKGTVYGILAGLVLTVTVILYMFTTTISFLLPYIMTFSLVGMIIYGVIREKLSRPPKESEPKKRKVTYLEYFDKK